MYICQVACTCNKPILHARIQEFLPRGSRPDCQKTALTTLFFFLFFLILNLFYSFREGVQWLFQRSYNFPRFQRVSNIFQDVHLLCFSRGEGPDPLSALWIRTCIVSLLLSHNINQVVYKSNVVKPSSARLDEI